MNANEYNFEIINLWKSNFKSLKSETNLVPSFCSDLNTDGILFVGCSFTYSLKSIERIKKKNNLDTPIFFRQYLDADIRQKQRIILNAILLDSIVKNDPVLNNNISRYADLSISLNLQWEHINLFALRCFDGDETIKRAVKISNEYQNNDWQGWKIDKIKPFYESQLDLSIQLMSSIKPKIIVVSNAFASKILLAKLANNITWIDEGGYHILNIKKRDIPIFFSSSLTSNSLDQGSYDRLKWHINKAYTDIWEQTECASRESSSSSIQ